MNPSTAPADKQTIAYGHLLAEASKLRRADQVSLVRALAGQVGMIAVFPGQLAQQAAPAQKGRKEKKGPSKRPPSNPLSGTPEKQAFDAAKKAVAKAKKENNGQLPADSPLVAQLEAAKDQYFRSLSKAKGSTTQVPTGPSDAVAPGKPAQQAKETPAPQAPKASSSSPKGKGNSK